MAKGSYQSIRGKISSDLKIDGKNFMLNVSVPPNTKATVYIPAKQNATITESGKVVNDVHYAKGYGIIEVGSGNYSFITESIY